MKKFGVLLVNLGSPDSPSVGDVHKYLAEFLMDPRVLDIPYPIRFGVVHFGILRSRPAQSAEAYRKIWSAEGSPLVVTSRKVGTALQASTGLRVEVAMRYGRPSVREAVEKLRAREITDVLLIPMFPHYAMSSYETAVERVRKVVTRFAPQMSLRVVSPYYDDTEYIDALVDTASEYLSQDYDHLLFSFHGLPQRHLEKAHPTRSHRLIDNRCCTESEAALKTCYRAQCFKTVEAFAQRANLPDHRFSVAFQSRLGREPWLPPYTDQIIAELGASGTKKLLVICPSFVTDCLETLEEIGIRGRETFIEAGGEELTLIPCLNDSAVWIEALDNWVRNWINSKSMAFNPRASAPELAEAER